MKRRSFSLREDLYYAVKGYAEKLNREKVWEKTDAPYPSQKDRYSTTEVSNLILLGKLPPVPHAVFFEWESFKNRTTSKTLGDMPLEAPKPRKAPAPKPPKAPVTQVEPLEAVDIYPPDFKKADREKLSRGSSTTPVVKPDEKSTDFTGGGITSF